MASSRNNLLSDILILLYEESVNGNLRIYKEYFEGLVLLRAKAISLKTEK